MTRLLAMWGVAAACTGGTETGNPIASAQLGLRAHSSDTAVATVGEPASGILVEAAWVVVGDVRLVHAEVCDAPGETEIDISGPLVVNIAAREARIEVFEPRATQYCRIRVPLERGDLPLPATAPIELEDAVIVVTGTTPQHRAFSLVSRARREVDVRSRSAPFSITAGMNALILAFDVATWFRGVDLDGATLTDGSIRVTDDHNRPLLDAFEDNTEQAVRLFRDLNSDAVLDAADVDVLLAEGGT